MAIGQNKKYHSVHTDEIGVLQSETAPPAKVNDTTEITQKEDSRLARWIRILTILQSMLSSLLSLAIAVWQGKVYFTYQRTKDMPGAWPDIPNLVPTILLFSISIAAFVFDVCMLLAYLMPGKKSAKWAIAIGNAAYYIVTSAKTVSYAISSAISKTSFDFGGATNQNTDLWSWTCTDQAATQDTITQAESNCNTQWASWYFALAQLAVEAFKWMITILAWYHKQRHEEDKGPDAQNKKFDEYSQGVTGQLDDLTPKFEVSVLSV